MQPDPGVSALQTAQTIAIIGVSNKPERYSYKVARYLQQQGYRIIPVNPQFQSLLGEESYKSLLDIPDDIRIDIVNIFREPTAVIPHMEEVIKRGAIKTVWLAEGASSPAAEAFAAEKGLHLIANQCIMVVDSTKEPTDG